MEYVLILSMIVLIVLKVWGECKTSTVTSANIKDNNNGLVKHEYPDGFYCFGNQELADKKHKEWLMKKAMKAMEDGQQ